MDHAVAQTQAITDQGLNFATPGFGFADDDVDVVFLEALQAVGQIGRAQIDELAVDARALIAQAARAGDDFVVKAFAAGHDGAQDHYFFATIRAADPIEDLTTRQRLNLSAALDAVLLADLGIEQAQIMINLGNRRDRRFFAALAEPLFDGDGRRDAGDVVDVGPRHHFEKLARVSRQTVDVAALSFGIDDIEGK